MQIHKENITFDHGQKKFERGQKNFGIVKKFLNQQMEQPLVYQPDFLWGKFSNFFKMLNSKLPYAIQHLLKLADSTEYKRDVFSKW